jgi:hypothetical protein
MLSAVLVPVNLLADPFASARFISLQMYSPLCWHSANSENKYVNIMKHTNHNV